MDQNTNFSPTGGSQPVNNPVNQQQSPNFSSNNFDDNNGSKKWIGWLSLVVLMATVLYFFGFWSWVAGLIPKSGEQTDDEQTEEQITEEVSEQNSESQDDSQSVVMGKGKISLSVSAGINLGATLLKGDSQPNVEIRKVYMHNTVKNSWLLVYDGFRPLDLNLLGATGEKHELISTMLAAVEYDRIKIEFADLVPIDQKGEQTVSRTRTVELVGPVIIKEGVNHQVNIWFDISDSSEPKPRAVLQ